MGFDAPHDDRLQVAARLSLRFFKAFFCVRREHYRPSDRWTIQSRRLVFITKSRWYQIVTSRNGA